MSCHTLRPEAFDLHTPPPPPGRSLCILLEVLPDWLEYHGYEVVHYNRSQGFLIRRKAGARPQPRPAQQVMLPRQKTNRQHPKPRPAQQATLF